MSRREDKKNKKSSTKNCGKRSMTDSTSDCTSKR